jgi:hypothetical protein
MSKLLRDLRERLLRAGIAPRHVRRYLRELSDHFSDAAADLMRDGHSRPESEATALARLGTVDDLAAAMIARPELRSWSARSPWIAFTFGPLLWLSVAYFAACFILWSGWRIFLPSASTPFVSTSGPIYGLENIYFQTGRAIYFGAPIFVGWAVALIAIRQRIRLVWPVLSSALLAFIGSTAQVHADRPMLEYPGQVSTTLGFAPGLYALTLRMLILFSFVMLPYFMFRVAIIFRASPEVPAI